MMNKDVANGIFAGVFYDKFDEYRLDYVQNIAQGVATVGTVVAFVNPPLGIAMASIGGVANGAINVYRGSYVWGTVEIVLSVIPYAGKVVRVVASTGGRVGGAIIGNTCRVSKPIANRIISAMAMEGEILEAVTVREIAHGETVKSLIKEVAELTYSNGGCEHAIISLKNGTRLIVRGGKAGIAFSDDVRRVILHTHPITTGPSPADLAMLRDLKQKSAWIYELFGGGLTKFWRK